MRLVSAALTVLLVAVGLAYFPAAVPPAAAADNASFDPGFIIADEVFYNSAALNADTIQSFIAAKDPNCVNSVVSGITYTCLRDYTQTTTARAADYNCAAVPAVSNERASSIIDRVSKACGINPQVILVTLQKEQRFITGGARSAAIYQKAMGYGCPDTSVCDSRYYGFFNQIYNAAWQFKQYKNYPIRTYQAGKFNSILFHPNVACGSSQVYIRNQATAGLYNYTPYQPNRASLAAGYGTGDSCSSYGNRNFWAFFTDWFGNPANLLPGGSFDGTSLSGWSNLVGSSTFALRQRDARAQAGTGLLSTVTATPGSSIAATISRSIAVDSTYEASLWVRSATATPVSGKLQLTATGGTAEMIATPFVSTEAWQLVRVSLPMALAGHTALRIEVVQDTANAELLLDSAIIAIGPGERARSPIPLSSASFEETTITGWARGAGNAVTFSSLAQSATIPAKAGTRFLSAITSLTPASVVQSVARPSKLGESYTVSAWVRSATAGSQFRGTLNLEGLGGIAEMASTEFLVTGADWTFVTTTLTVASSDHSSLRVGVGLLTAGRSLLVDDVQLVPNLLANPSGEGFVPAPSPATITTSPVTITAPSFEESTPVGWVRGAGNAITLTAMNQTTAVPAKAGTRFLAAITSTTPASFVQPITRASKIGDIFTLTAWVRSATAGTQFRGTLRVEGLGGVDEVAATEFLVGGDVWTQVTSTLRVTSTDHSSVRIGVSLLTSGRSLLVDDVRLTHGVPASTAPVEATAPAAGWRPTSGDTVTALVVTDKPRAADGSGYLRFSRAVFTSTSPTRIASDVARKTRVGETFTLSGWFRSGSPTVRYVGAMQIVGRGGPNPAEVTSIPIDVGATWTYFTVTMTFATTHDSLRAELQLGTMPFPLEVDGLVLR